MSEHWKRTALTVGVPKDPDTLFRLVRDPQPTQADFLPDCDTRGRGWTEDWATYRAFSAWGTFSSAQAHGLDLNEHRSEEDDPFTHVVEFKLWPHRWHATAWLPPVEDHFAVWAGADEALSRVQVVHPIEGQQE